MREVFDFLWGCASQLTEYFLTDAPWVVTACIIVVPLISYMIRKIISMYRRFLR